MKGFALIELFLVIIIIVFLAGLALPLSLDFYRGQQLETQCQGLVQNLRWAQLKAMTGELDSNYGLYFQDNSYTFFKGSSYSLRDQAYDMIFDLPLAIDLSGISEIVFLKVAGSPSVTGLVVLTAGNLSCSVIVNEIGRVSLQ